MMKLRPAQEKVLAYQKGYMAVSAVPGSGKTFTLTRLAVELVLKGKLDLERGQQILIVTYLNTSVDNFKKGIRKRLLELDKVPEEYESYFDVRTLHSLGLEVLRYAGISNPDNPANDIDVTDEVRSHYFLTTAIDNWIEANEEKWEAYLPDESPQAKSQWRYITNNMARNFIRTAKNEQYSVEQIQSRLTKVGVERMPWVDMLAGIYAQYQHILLSQGAFDFNDLILQAVELLQNRPDLTHQLRHRWAYILEDEAQDSVPLQEALLKSLSGNDGNLVRVGDPNQAITTTFTSAHPRYFKEFMAQPKVQVRPLPNSGRCAPIIFGAANELVNWVCDKHPVEEVRENTFLHQMIEPTPPGDAQPNPDPIGDGIRIKVYKNQEDNELPGVAKLATQYVEKFPDHTIAILVPTHRLGHIVAQSLDLAKADYDNLLRGGVRVREVAAALHALLAVLADPLRSRHLLDAYKALQAIEHPAAMPPFTDEREAGRFDAILRSVTTPEDLFFPRDGESMITALPQGVGEASDYERIERFAIFVHDLFDLRPLPVADLALTLSDRLFIGRHSGEAETDLAQHERDLDVAYQIANVLQRWADSQPNWRLPDLVANLEDVAKGRQALVTSRPGGDDGFEPRKGVITLATQHAAKGLEWDAVFLVAVDGRWIPASLDGYFQGTYDFLGGEDPTADVMAQLKVLMAGDGADFGDEENAGIYQQRSATQSAHIDIISERLRLFYVGITRAKRFLHISRSRATRRRGQDQPVEPATVMAVLYQYLKSNA